VGSIAAETVIAELGSTSKALGVTGTIGAAFVFRDGITIAAGLWLNAAARAASEPPFGVVEAGVVRAGLSVAFFLGVRGLLTGAFGVDTADFGDATALVLSVLTLTGTSVTGASWSRRGLNGVDAILGVVLGFGIDATLAAALGEGDAACSGGKVRIGTLLREDALEVAFGDGETGSSVATVDFGDTVTRSGDVTFGDKESRSCVETVDLGVTAAGLATESA